MNDDREVQRRRGRRAAKVGADFEREFIIDFHEATGIKLKRQLKERREGNLGDIEFDDRVPFGFQCRKRKQGAPLNALLDAEAALVRAGLGDTHYPAGIVERRIGARGKANPRGVIMYHDDWLELLELFLADGQGILPWLGSAKTGSKFPRLWEALEAARIETVLRPGWIPVGIGIVTGGGRNHDLIDYDGWLRVMGALYTRRILG